MRVLCVVGTDLSQVRVGMAIGRTTGHAAHLPDQPKANPTEEEKQRAKQRIEGSLAPSAGTKSAAM